MNEDHPCNAAAPGATSPTKPLGDVIAINESLIKDHLDKIVVCFPGYFGHALSVRVDG